MAAQAKDNERAGGNTGGVGRQKSANPLNTRDELAKAAGVSHDTIHKVEAILADAPEEVKEQVRHGEKSINKAYQEVVDRRTGAPAAPG